MVEPTPSQLHETFEALTPLQVRELLGIAVSRRLEVRELDVERMNLRILSTWASRFELELREGREGAYSLDAMLREAEARLRFFDGELEAAVV